MYKLIIIIISIFLLASCANTSHNAVSEMKIEGKNALQVAPYAEFSVEDESEITGIALSMTTRIESPEWKMKFFWQMDEATKNTQKTNQQILRSRRYTILENFPEFTDNPTTDFTPENFTIDTSIWYRLNNTVYHSAEPMKKININKTRLVAGFQQNYNSTYTGSLWDLPLATPYYAWKSDATSLMHGTTFATKSNTSQGFFDIKEIADGTSGMLASNIYTSDNTYARIPDTVTYHLDLLKPIFDFIKQKPQLNHSFEFSMYIPTTHEITDIIYENRAEKISLKNDENFHFAINDDEWEYRINIAKNKKILENASGKITVFIAEKTQ